MQRYEYDTSRHHRPPLLGNRIVKYLIAVWHSKVKHPYRGGKAPLSATGTVSGITCAYRFLSALAAAIGSRLRVRRRTLCASSALLGILSSPETVLQVSSRKTSKRLGQLKFGYRAQATPNGTVHSAVPHCCSSSTADECAHSMNIH